MVDPVRSSASSSALKPELLALPQISEQNFFTRQPEPSMGMAVARRTIFRDSDEQRWSNVARRVAAGSLSVLTHAYPELAGHPDVLRDQVLMEKHIAKGALLMSGRHLQHGDEDQWQKPQEIMTNCSSSMSSFMLFLLLLSGSGVGRPYDDEAMLVDWTKQPEVILASELKHPDFLKMPAGTMALHTIPDEILFDAKTRLFVVPDSREGWAQAVEVLEVMTFEGKHDWKLILDFSDVRPENAPIRGMQNRPASGPAPLMAALAKIAEIRNFLHIPLWKATMMVDHFLAECVLVGGARRSARMATKYWKDPGAAEFATFKHDHRDEYGFPIFYSSNNSLAVDAEFWSMANEDAQELFALATYTAYHDGTGEPGFVNFDKLVTNNEGLETYVDGEFVGSSKFQPMQDSKKLLAALARVALGTQYSNTVNPCSEIPLLKLGGYCVLGSVVPYHADSLDEAEESFRIATRALIRTNLMDALYGREVARTNRIGVGMAGIHEFAWDRFGYGFRDLIDEEKSQDFWRTIARFARAVQDEGYQYSKALGMNVPHTMRTLPPAGTIGKIHGLTEAAHLPARREYLRWVQFRSTAPELDEYRALGYPVRELKTYKGTTIVGFPTQPLICKLGMGDKLVLASEATPEEQYRWLMLLEKYWLRGVDEQGNLLEDDRSSQVSYTLKVDPAKVSYPQFVRMLLDWQPKVKCCSVLLEHDTSAYEYLPEEQLDTLDFLDIVARIKDDSVRDALDMSTLMCASGACGLDYTPEGA